MATVLLIFLYFYFDENKRSFVRFKSGFSALGINKSRFVCVSGLRPIKSH